MTEGFRSMLAARQREVNSLVCVGLDPVWNKMPRVILEYVKTYGIGPALRIWAENEVNATAPFACLYKPNIAFWAAIPGGLDVLRGIIEFIHKKYPGIPVFLDCKRGDIDNTQVQYGVEAFNIFGVDGMNFTPYMGRGCMSALVKPEWDGKALVAVCYTSNPEARKIQDLAVVPSSTLWECIARYTLQWAGELGVTENAGLVMGLSPKGDLGKKPTADN